MISFTEPYRPEGSSEAMSPHIGLMQIENKNWIKEAEEMGLIREKVSLSLAYSHCFLKSHQYNIHFSYFLLLSENIFKRSFYMVKVIVLILRGFRIKKLKICFCSELNVQNWTIQI